MPSREDVPTDAMVTLSQAAWLIGQTRQLIYRWRERGLLDKDDEGRVRYGSVLDAETRTWNNQQPGAWRRKERVKPEAMQGA